ncbi:hypothetical protein PTTW11_01291 [Pyrenophora teres f. teres]|uniref:Uncharacterized protein n=1 Tax=Pyrenophora teres f. teres TaxID=97479 RepID=A0A6S6VHU2_9PLEO|nr:hypothetical protein PTTW11_01291 [Pyrenophora teres f. teres]
MPFSANQSTTRPGSRQTAHAEVHYERLTETNQAVSPLLSLPPELRNRIYEFVLAPTHPRNTTLEVYTRNPIGPPPVRKYLAPLSTCLQMRAEGFVMFYSLHIFGFHYLKQIMTFAATVGEAACSVVTSVRLVVQAITIYEGAETVQAAVEGCLLMFLELEHVWVQIQNLFGVPWRTWFKVQHAVKSGLNTVFD